MLTQLRGGLNSIFVLILLGLLIASFAIWGIGDVFTARSAKVASVGETDISAAKFQGEFQNRLRTLQAQFGPEFDTQQAISLGLHRAVLGEMVRRATLDEEARTLGLRAADSQVADAIRQMEAFFGADGAFNKFNYDMALNGAGLTAQAFEASMRVDLARLQLVDSIMAAKPLPKSLVDALYTFRKERRTAEIVNIPAASMTDLDELDEAALLAAYEIGKSNYMTPEYRDIQLLFVDPVALAGEIEISEEDLRAAYDERAEIYQEDENRTLNVMVMETEANADAAYARIQAGEAFADVAEDMLGFTADDISLGELDYYTLADDYNQAAAERVFALEVGATSAPTQTLFGWHLFQVADISGGITRSFDDVRAELLEEMRAESGLDAVYNLVAEIDDIIAAGGDMDAVAAATSLVPVKYTGIDHAGVRQDGSIIDNAGPMHDYIEAAFGKLPGDDLDLLDMDNGGFYLAQVDMVYPPAPRPFEDVREQIRTGLYADQRIAKAGALANELSERAKSGAALKSIADSLNYSWFETDILQRDEASIQLSRGVKDLIFSLEEGAIGIERSATGDGYLLVQVKSIIPGLPDQDAADYVSLRQRLLAEMENDLIGQYQLAVQNSLGVEVDMELVEQLFSPDRQANTTLNQF